MPSSPDRPTSRAASCRRGWLALLILSFLALPALGVAQEPAATLQERFRVAVEWRDAAGRTGVGNSLAISEAAVAFTFLDDRRVELVVKILDGGAINGHFWVFVASLTTAELTVRVEDTVTGAGRSYRQAAGEARSLSDFEAFPSLGGDALAPALATVSDARPEPRRPGAYGPPTAKVSGEAVAARCAPHPRNVCLAAGARFEVTVIWRSGDPMEVRRAHLRRLTDRAAYAWFFDRGSPEVVIAVLDGRAVNGAFWVVAASLTHLAYEIEVTDTGSGRTRRYPSPGGELTSSSDRAAFAESAHPPRRPVIVEPGDDGERVNGLNLHFETRAFADPDEQDEHYCSDFEIWRTPEEGVDERVWRARCLLGSRRTHIRPGDGTFEGSRLGQESLQLARPHRLRVRHRDDTGVWSPWAERSFVPSLVFQAFPLRLRGMRTAPPPRWRFTAGGDVVLPTAAVAPALRLETLAGEVLYTWSAGDGTANAAAAGVTAAASDGLRAVASAGSLAELRLAESEIRLTDEAGRPHVLYLPALAVRRGQPAALWLSSNGSSFWTDFTPRDPLPEDLARHTPRPWAACRPNLRVEPVAAGFQLPVALAFLPRPGPRLRDPLFYVGELYGQIKVVRRSGRVDVFARDLLNFDPIGNFPGSGELGLTSLLVDPASGDVFASLVYRWDGGDPLSPLSGRVIRIESRRGGLQAGRISTLLDTAPDQIAPAHQISHLSFGPDGKLYVHVGDGFQPGEAQNLHSFLGKILRLNPDGSPPPDNPFYDPGDGFDAADYVFAYGFRNPFGGAWRGRDGALYEVENGPQVDRLARVDRGADYGWGLAGSNVEMRRRAIYNWGPPAHAPVGIVFLEPDLFGGSGFPDDWMDHALVAEFGKTSFPGPLELGKRITELVLAGDGRLLAPPRAVIEYDGHGQATIIGLTAGPDGLYFTDFFPELGDPLASAARVWRLRYRSR